MAKQTLTVQLMHANLRIAELESQLAALTAPAPRNTVVGDAPDALAFEHSQRGWWAYTCAVRKHCINHRVSVQSLSLNAYRALHNSYQDQGEPAF